MMPTYYIVGYCVNGKIRRPFQIKVKTDDPHHINIDELRLPKNSSHYHLIDNVGNIVIDDMF